MMKNKEYQRRFEAFQNKEITTQEWKKYCTTILNELLKENKEVLTRIKYV